MLWWFDRKDEAKRLYHETEEFNKRFSSPLLAAFEKYQPLTVVLLDAHLDYRDRSNGMEFTNNNPFRRAHELSFIKRIVTIEVRGIKSTDREYRESLTHGNLVFPVDHVHDAGIATIVSKIGDLGNYYVSLDIDALDLSTAPGTESPEADGLTFRQAKQLIHCIAGSGKLVGLDLVEVNPYLDHAELTQHLRSVIARSHRIRFSNRVRTDIITNTR